MTITRRPLLALPALLLARPATAQGAPVKVGTLLPLTGVAASAGNSGKAAIDLAVELINTPQPDLAAMPLMATAGFPGLGGRPLQVVIADQQGSPSVAQNQALRLITQERVVALTSGYQSGLVQTASAIAERHGIPYVTGEAVATNLTERGFRWFFRTTPIGPDIAAIYVEFLQAARVNGRAVSKVAIVNENTEYGTSIADVIKQDRRGARHRHRIADPLCREQRRRLGPGAAAEGGAAGCGDLHQLHLGRHPLCADDAGAGLPAADHDRRQFRLLRR